MSGSKERWNGNKMVSKDFAKIFSEVTAQFSSLSLNSKDVKYFLAFLSKTEDFCAFALMDLCGC
jgi:hypothetical protein